MRWINQHLVGKRQELVVKRIVEPRAKVVGRPAERSPQVRAAHVADKERVAGENRVGFGGVFLKIENQDGDRLNRMPGSFEHLQPQARKIKRVAVLHRHEGIFGFSLGAQVDSSAAPVAQFQMSGEEIGVKVSEKDVLDSEAGFLSVGQILLDVSLRIDDDPSRRSFIAEQIGGVRETAQVILFQDNRNPPA